jgi:hypothetical protein
VQLDGLILGAQKPSRHAGGELNAVRKRRLDQMALKLARSQVQRRP